MPFYLAFLLLLVTFLLTSPSSHAQSTKPNFLMIVIDDLNGNVGVMGDYLGHTPRLDELISRGLLLNNHHVQVSECSPSRVSMLSGLRTDEIKVFAREPSFRRRNRFVVTLPGYLRTKGYTTVSVGKVFDWPAFSDSPNAAGQPIELCAPDAPRTLDTAFECSFDRSFPTLYARLNKCVCPNVAESPYPFGPNPNNAHIPLVWGETQTSYLDELAWDDCHANTAISQMQQLSRQSTPWFLAVGFFRPHLPWSAPHEFFSMYGNGEEIAKPVLAAGLTGEFFLTEASLNGKYDSQEIIDYIGAQGQFPTLAVDSVRRVRGYYASTTFVDFEVGRVIDALDVSSAASNTLIIVWGDNGFHLGPAIWGKKTVYEAATRTPLAIIPHRTWHGGATMAKGKISNSPVESIDIYPTVLDLLGIPKPPFPLHGLSLVPLLSDPTHLVKQAAMSEYHSYVMTMQRMGYTLRTERFRVIAYYVFDGSCWGVDGECTIYSSARDLSIKLEMYDLGPPGFLVHEEKNVAAEPEYQDELNRLLGFLDNKTPSMSMMNGGTSPPTPRPIVVPTLPTPFPTSTVKPTMARPTMKTPPTTTTITQAPSDAPVANVPDTSAPTLPTHCHYLTYSDCIAHGCQWKNSEPYSVACRIPPQATIPTTSLLLMATSHHEDAMATSCTVASTKTKCNLIPNCSWSYISGGNWRCIARGPTAQATILTRHPTINCDTSTNSPVGVRVPTMPTTMAPIPAPVASQCLTNHIRSNCISAGCVWKKMGWQGFRCVAPGFGGNSDAPTGLDGTSDAPTSVSQGNTPTSNLGDGYGGD